jgi:hypothetical protein
MIKLATTLLAAICFSCNAASQERGSLSEPVKSSSVQMDSATGVKPRTVVTDFMRFISRAEKDKANELLQPEGYPPAPANLAPDKVHGGVEAVRRLDWVEVLAERKFRLVNIVDEKVEGDSGTLTADLGTTDVEAFRERARFYLTKVNGRWLISDIELLGKPPSSSNRT